MAVTQTHSTTASSPIARPLDDLLSDRRRSERRSINAKGFISTNALDETEGHVVKVLDLSLTGVGFQSPVALIEGHKHQIIVMAGPLRLSSRMRVAFCRRTEDGFYEIGAEFQ